MSIDIEQELAKVRARRAASPAGTGPALDIEAELAKVRARRAASVRAQYAAGDIPGFTTPERGPIRETPITQALRGYTRGYLMPISGRVKELQPVPERVKPVTMPQVRAQYAAGDIPGFTRPQRGPVEAIGGQRVAPVETIAEFAGASVGLPQRIVTGIAARIAPLGWHVVVYFEMADLPELVSFFTSLPTTVVVDHMGRPDVTKPVDGPEFEF